ncbi:4-alpha-glucanotransferase [Desulfobacca acetoxidans]
MTGSNKELLLAELASLYGLAPSYTDNAGQNHPTTSSTQAAILRTMGLQCQSEVALREELNRRRCLPWTRLTPPVLALCQSQYPAVWDFHTLLQRGRLPHDLKGSWEILDESGQCIHSADFGPELQVIEVKNFGTDCFGRTAIPLPQTLALGYYDLKVRVETSGFERESRTLLIIAPERVYTPMALLTRRLWGFSVPLYALRSQTDWGIGDLGDLQRLLGWAAGLKASVIGLNPLHHLGLHLDQNVSPYYPTSRCYSNPLYLDLSQVPELATCRSAQEYLAQPQVQRQLDELRQGQRINYPAVATLKFKVLEMLLNTFLEQHGLPALPLTTRGRDFAAFLACEGEPLQRFATFLALSESWRTAGCSYATWQEWPSVYHNPQGPAVAEFACTHQRQILLYAYAQWLLAGQLQDTSMAAAAWNLPLGLYFDLAVGVNPGGFDTWAEPGLFALDADIGAPPDEFSPLGQNWGLAPLLPEHLRESRYRYFIRMVRHNCPPVGALRLDHVMGLFRLYWIPKGLSPAEGVYVQYPAEEMLKILALESVRRQTAIIGEDLGTVAPYIRDILGGYRILSTRLFYFERRDDGSFTPAEDYPDWVATSITTHDLPTLAGFWQGQDIQMRQQLNLFPNNQAATRAWEDRRRAKLAILSLLQHKGWLPPDTAQNLAESPELPEEVKWRVISHLAQTPCRLLLLSLEDIFGWLDQQNLPGTKDEYPNWRVKLPKLLEEIEKAKEPQQAAEIIGCFRD